jgi:chromatin remodeling complex protein RSC6
MAAPPIPNTWHLRTVAEVSAKNCMICLKPSTAVLITPDNKDFFYICRGHLKDRGFCSPVENVEEKKKEALRIEREKVEKEYREKLAAKEKKEADKNKKEGDKDKEKDVREKDEERDKKTNAKDKEAAGVTEKKDDDKTAQNSAADNLPRIYSLHR